MSSRPTWSTNPSQAGPSQPRLPAPPQLPNTVTQSHNAYQQQALIPDLSTEPHPITSGPSSIPDPEAGAEPPRSSSPPATTSGLGQLVEPHQELNSFLERFWTRQMEYVERDNPEFKTFPLPLARIKKVMKSDEEVKMISAEAPIMFSKACEIFISELTCRAWLIAESKKRRTLQKSDVAAAIALSDMFDFLIDILPRDDDGVVEQEDQVGGVEVGVEEDTAVEGEEGAGMIHANGAMVGNGEGGSTNGHHVQEG